ncbi:MULTISPECIES: NUDIX hydrolase [Rhodobacterales]|jgi:8-oxo-dGTP diphosphatase|uniref:NUDIX domain protein n=1 Tax=Phaeobacter gallaeciensis TaxID=60890 RepID=A0A1B0ZRT1_9RHOB|nr:MULTISPECIES: NUDIX hydrolase [Phaeobacter]MDF1773309.1 NUDIX hydrolase [Pseudophaeobacter sp. bin_em_oilr2.035]MEE2635469.1 NUDIX hydrolase [Pseudomonadota bacterium]ANP36867.1 NUDIX domain protein [Phaeobacter gallaeciensis]MDE4061014.1 NUDIX hydrolase [Phaeobacter gallaeciensis]MDE4097831.1 NUDIX hydrolase [Phaeobacter gallaeciensis]
MTFSGAKLALFLGQKIVVILRDDKPDIPYPGHWDLPGGGREQEESPEVCALRETEEEIGLQLAPSDLVWSRRYSRPRGYVWFFVSHQPAGLVSDIRLGSEGQRWALMDPREYCEHPLAVPHFAEQLSGYLSEARA